MLMAVLVVALAIDAGFRWVWAVHTGQPVRWPVPADCPPEEIWSPDTPDRPSQGREHTELVPLAVGGVSRAPRDAPEQPPQLGSNPLVEP